MKKLVAMMMLIVAMMSVGCTNDVADEEVVEVVEPQTYISYGVTDDTDSVTLYADEYDELFHEVEATHNTDGVMFDDLGECNFEVKPNQYVYVVLNDNGTPTDISDDYVMGCILDVETNIYNELESNLREAFEDDGYIIERDGNNIRISLAE